MTDLTGLSPNFGPRKDGLRPEFIILHYTAMQSAEAAVARLCDPVAEVSAHYLITRTGETVPLVAESERAWHAGAGTWCGKADMNSRSIGIELDNDGASPFSAPLMDALEPLLAGIKARWGIAPDCVIGHSDMAPGRKIDPGPRFDWMRLARQGLAAFPDVDPVTNLRDNACSEVEISDLLTQVGYSAKAPLPDRLQAFRDRFLPGVTGAPNGADRLMLLQYLNDYPVDRTGP